MLALFCGCLGFWLGVGVGFVLFFDWRTPSVRMLLVVRYSEIVC